jgi:hypothetical protein
MATNARYVEEVRRIVLESLKGYEVDVVALDDAPVGLREKVLERGIRWNG